MTVFKNYFKMLKSYKFVICLYTCIFLTFTIILCTNPKTGTTFVATKPDIAVISLDENSDIVENITKYLEKYANIQEIQNDETKINDALFYEDISGVLYIYDGYTQEYLENKDKPLEVKYGIASTSTYLEMILNRYFKIADIANDEFDKQEDILNYINTSLEKETQTEVKTSLDTTSLGKAQTFFDFSNYTILAICIYITSIILIRFNNEKIQNRNKISPTKMSKILTQIYMGNIVFGIFFWIILLILSYVIIGKTMLSIHGIAFAINSFIFLLCAISLGILVSNLAKGQNTVNAIVNIFALGSSFMCGSFIPVTFLPEKVVTISKVLPSYYFTKNNTLISKIETWDFENIKPLLTNAGIIFCFTICFLILANEIIRRKKK